MTPEQRTRHDAIINRQGRYVIYQQQNPYISGEDVAVATTDDLFQAWGMLGLYGGDYIWDNAEMQAVEHGRALK